MAKTRRRAMPKEREGCEDCAMGLPCPHAIHELVFANSKYGRRGNAPKVKGKRKGT